MKPRNLRYIILAALLAMNGLSTADITFESPYTFGNIGALNGGVANTATNAPFTGQQGWSLSTSTGTGSAITTATSGEYVGGKAFSKNASNASSRTYIGGKLGIVETSVTNTITFVARFGAGSGFNIMAGFLGDTDVGGGDGLFDNADAGMQFGGAGGGFLSLYRDDSFGKPTVDAPSGTLNTGSWYRYSVVIGESISGIRAITMSVRNLTLGADVDINGALAGNFWDFSVTDAQFGVAPEDGKHPHE